MSPNNPYEEAGGAGFNHELASGRDWEDTLDAIHAALLKKWYYVATATNTKRGWFNPIMKKGIDLSRAKKQIPEELKTIIKLKFTTFDELQNRIKKESRRVGDKDIWHFKSKWKEFPSGTAIVEIHQRPTLNYFASEIRYRRAFIVLDGDCEVEHQNSTMLLINKIMKDEKYSKELLKSVKKTPVKEAKMKQSRIYEGRPITDLVLLLRDAPTTHIKSINIEERTALRMYFKRLKVTNEFSMTHKEIEELLQKTYPEEG